jgi:hypothetical protein
MPLPEFHRIVGSGVSENDLRQTVEGMLRSYCCLNRGLLNHYGISIPIPFVVDTHQAAGAGGDVSGAASAGAEAFFLRSARRALRSSSRFDFSA